MAAVMMPTVTRPAGVVRSVSTGALRPTFNVPLPVDGGGDASRSRGNFMATTTIRATRRNSARHQRGYTFHFRPPVNYQSVAQRPPPPQSGTHCWLCHRRGFGSLSAHSIATSTDLPELENCCPRQPCRRLGDH